MKRSLVIVAVLFLLAISIGPTATATPSIEQTLTNTQASSAPNPIRLLLIAEFARVSQDYPIASQNYFLLAQEFAEPLFGRRATLYAIRANDLTSIAITSELWGKIEPTNAYPQFLAATYLINQQNSQAAQHYIDNLFFQNSDKAIAATEAIYNGLSQPQAKSLLLKMIKHLALKYPHNYQLTYAAAWLALQQQQYDLAWQQINKALAVKTVWPEAMLLRAQILIAQQDNEAAIKYLQQQITQNQNNNLLKLYYANLLLETKQLAAAKQQFQALTLIPEQKALALTQLGRIAYQQQQIDEANNLLRQAVLDDKNNDSARFLLGEITQKENHLGEALSWYKSITSERYYLSAQIHAALLYAATGNSKKAITALNQLAYVTPAEYKTIALAKIKILLQKKSFYSALAIVDDGLKALPQDMDLLLLGSTVAQQATDYSLAVNYLATAYQIAPTSTTAANYGALLWQTGDRTKAQQIWQSALSKDPNNKFLNDTIKKFATQ